MGDNRQQGEQQDCTYWLGTQCKIAAMQKALQLVIVILLAKSLN